MANKTPASPPQSSQPQPSGPTFSELSAEWQQIVRALTIGSQQLLVRLAALEQHGQIGPDAANGYAGWVKRVADALANVPPEAPQE